LGEEIYRSQFEGNRVPLPGDAGKLTLRPLPPRKYKELITSFQSGITELMNLPLTRFQLKKRRGICRDYLAETESGNIRIQVGDDIKEIAKTDIVIQHQPLNRRNIGWLLQDFIR